MTSQADENYQMVIIIKKISLISKVKISKQNFYEIQINPFSFSNFSASKCKRVRQQGLLFVVINVPGGGGGTQAFL